MKKLLAILLFIGVIIIGKSMFFSDVKSPLLTNIQEKLNISENTSDEPYENDFKVNRLQPALADFHFSNLTENQKAIYLAIAQNVKILNTVFEVKNYKVPDTEEALSADVTAVISAFFDDHPEVFYLGTEVMRRKTNSFLSSKLQLELTYTVSSMEELDTALDKLETIIDAYTKDVHWNELFYMELYLHDSFARNVTYYKHDKLEKISQEYHTAYAALIKKEAVCDGMSKAMQLLLDRAGIKSIFITGKMEDVNHGWNMVNIEDEWYHLDITSNKYSQDINLVAHTYFNITTEELLKTHTINDIKTIPAANATENNFYIKNNCYIYKADNFRTKITEITERQESSNCLEFATDHTNDVPGKLINILYDLNFDGYKFSHKKVNMNYYNHNNTYLIPKVFGRN